MKKLLTILLLGASALASAQTKYTNPVLNMDFADPSIQRGTDGIFYAYATGCVVAKSSDLINWTRVNNVFSRPTWNDSTYVKDGQTKTDYYSLWASDVNYVDGRYIMYYASALWGNGSRTGIGVSTGTTPTKFTDKGRMFRSTEIKVENSIDPCYIEEGDKKYLAWGSFNGIYIAELTADGLAVKDFNNIKKIAGTAFEGAMIHKRGNYYYLFASTGSCCEGTKSTYETVVGRSKSLMGPYLDKNNQLMTSNKRTIIITRNAQWAGPGHNSEIITDDEGQDWIMYHAYSTKTPDVGRVLMLDRLKWDATGWPYIEKGSPSSTEKEGPIFYSANGRHCTYKMQNTDFHKSRFRNWTSQSDGCEEFQSGLGTVFNPVMHAKGGTFSLQQDLGGLTDAIYEVNLQNANYDGDVQIMAGSVLTPVDSQPATDKRPTADEMSKAFQNGTRTQRAFGLAYNGKLTVGIRGNMTAQGSEYWAGNVELIRRDNDEEALQSVCQWYDTRATLALTDQTANSYYLGKLDTYLQDLRSATDYSTRYKAVVNVHKTLSSMNALAPDYQPQTSDAVRDLSAQSNASAQTYYDTLGRRVDSKHPGLVISQGKKQLRK